MTKHQVEVVLYEEAAELRDQYLPPNGTHFESAAALKLACDRLFEAAKQLRALRRAENLR